MSTRIDKTALDLIDRLRLHNDHQYRHDYDHMHAWRKIDCDFGVLLDGGKVTEISDDIWNELMGLI